jgi:membrane fusion protein (multidrug efflux system)
VTLAAIVAKPQQLQANAQGLGTLLPAESVELKCETSGRVSAILFREGQSVEAGTPLVQLANDELRASLQKASAKLQQAQASWQRRQEQYTAQAISQQEWEAARAELRSAEADSSLLVAQLAKTTLRAPFRGVVGLRAISLGQVLTIGTTVTTLVQRLPLRLEFSLPEKFARYALPGARLAVKNNDGSATEAKILARDGMLDPSTRTLMVRATITGKSEALVPGQAVEFDLPLPVREVLMVPSEAVGGSATGSTLFLYRGGKAERVGVVLGGRETDRVEILAGLQAGDTVLCTGAAPVRPGSAVQLSTLRAWP